MRHVCSTLMSMQPILKSARYRNSKIMQDCETMQVVREAHACTGYPQLYEINPEAFTESESVE